LTHTKTDTVKTAFLITEKSDTETPIVGVLSLKSDPDITIDALKIALADHFDVDSDLIFVHKVDSLKSGIPVWESEQFEVDLGGGEEAVIEIRSIYVY
jgi:hypothetical protein